MQDSNVQLDIGVKSTRVLSENVESLENWGGVIIYI